MLILYNYYLSKYFLVSSQKGQMNNKLNFRYVLKRENFNNYHNLNNLVDLIDNLHFYKRKLTIQFFGSSKYLNRVRFMKKFVIFTNKLPARDFNFLYLPNYS